MSAVVRVEVDGAIAVVTVDNPPVNAIGDPVLDGLEEAAAHLAADADVRAVVLTGAGEKAFMAGADLREFERMLAGGQGIDEHTAATRRILGLWERMPQPVVAAVQASALGGGLEVALVCDLIVADPAARFGFPEVRLGLIPGAGGTQRLPARIGVGPAKQLLLLGGSVDADDSLRLGLVSRIAARGRALEEARELAERLAALPAVAVRAAKRAVAATIEDGLDREHELFLQAFASHDVREGVRAFLEKRSPSFLHR
jgi:enoyl-CoA hydratase/carnithine racemase